MSLMKNFLCSAIQLVSTGAPYVQEYKKNTKHDRSIGSKRIKYMFVMLLKK